jgi:hypothetical protein
MEYQGNTKGVDDMTDLERAAMVVNGLKKYAEKLLPNDRFAFSLSLQEAEAAIRALPQRSVEPVGYVMQAKKDGSIGKEIAPVKWSTFEKELAKIKAHPWVVNGVAEVIPLYAHPPADDGMQEVAINGPFATSGELGEALGMSKEAAGQFETRLEAIAGNSPRLVVEPPDEKRAAYAKANPLGGPATMFETIAGRIRAGEEFYAVLADYGLSLNDHGGGCPDDASDKKDAERGRFLIANSVWHRHGNSTYMAVRVADGADLSCVAMRENAIDAAIAAAGKENGNA